VRVAEIAAPQREADGRAQDERRPLPGRHGLQLEQRPADQLSGFVIGARFDEHQTEIKDRAEPGDARRRELERGSALRLRFRPAAQLEQDVRGIAAEKRAVGQPEPVARGLGDALFHHRQRLLATQVKVEQGRLVRVANA